MNPDAPNFSPRPSALSLSEFLARHARPYDPATDDYERPPFAADIKEGKNDPIYNAHSYHPISSTTRSQATLCSICFAGRV
jgi:hypothetical protein